MTAKTLALLLLLGSLSAPLWAQGGSPHTLPLTTRVILVVHLVS